MRWICSGSFLPPLKRTSASARLASHRHRVPNTGESSTACSSTSWTDAVLRNLNTSASGKLCCSASAMLMPSSVAAACSSKLNERQNRFRSANPHALLMRPPNGAWMTSCMPPPSSKKRSATMVCWVGTVRRTARPSTMYSTACSAPAAVEAAVLHQPGDGFCGFGAATEAGADRQGRVGGVGRADAGPDDGFLGTGLGECDIGRTLIDLLAYFGDVRRQLRRTCGCFAAPEGDRRRRAVRVLDEHAAGADAPDLPRRVAEQHDVARGAFDREVLVDGTDRGPFGLGDHGVERGFGNRAAAGDRRQPGSAAGAEALVDAVAMEVRAVASATRGDALGQHRDDLVECRALQIPVRIRAPDQREQRIFIPTVSLGGARRDDLLRQDVERRLRDDQLVQLAAANRQHQRRAFDQLVARRDEEAALGRGAAPVSGAANPLDRRRDRAR